MPATPRTVTRRGRRTRPGAQSGADRRGLAALGRVAGARGGKQAGVLLRALGVGLVLDYLALDPLSESANLNLARSLEAAGFEKSALLAMALNVYAMF